jgi:hypothetical protein
MTSQNTQSLLLEPRTRQGSQRARFGQLGQRLADAFRAVDRPEAPGDGDTQPIEPLTPDVLPRFPMSRHGYHCGSVDEYVTALEQEIAALGQEIEVMRAQPKPADEVRSEIERIGTQTSAVLIAANQQRDEILRGAREEADRCIAEARAEASTLRLESEGRLRELRASCEAVEQERDRLLEDARSVSVALAALAEGAKP